MRALPLLVFAVLAFSVGARAQTQDQSLSARLQRGPNSNLTYDVRQSSFGKTANVSKSFDAGTFQYDQKFSPKSFSAKTFAGTKSAWMGDLKFATKSASTGGRYEIPNISKKADVKTVAVKDAAESGKTMAVQTYAGQRSYLTKGRSQDRLDNQGKPKPGETVGWTGDSLKPMTIEDVRQLLNKNK